MSRQLTIATDGACKNNPGVGGWGYVATEESSRANVKWMSFGGKKITTNNEMELTAIVRGLEFAPSGSQIHLISDSKYCLNGIGSVKTRTVGHRTTTYFNGWMNKWERNGWVAGKNKPVANMELWQKIASLIRKHCEGGSVFSFEHVNGHCGHPLNEIADSLANMGVAHIRQKAFSTR